MYLECPFALPSKRIKTILEAGAGGQGWSPGPPDVLDRHVAASIISIKLSGERSPLEKL